MAFAKNLVDDYGAVPGGSTDCLTALQSAAASGRRVQIPKGNYRCSASLTIAEATEFEGETEEGARIAFDTDKAGIVLQHDLASLEKLKITGGFTTPAAFHGVRVRARCQLRRVTVAGFPGHGFLIDGNSPYNACLVQMFGCKGYDNGKCGIFASGIDGNGGVVVGFRANGNLDFGIDDQSYLGNTYLGCWVEDNNAKGYKTAGVENQASFVGCYCEPTEAITLAPHSDVFAPYPGDWSWLTRP